MPYQLRLPRGYPLGAIRRDCTAPFQQPRHKPAAFDPGAADEDAGPSIPTVPQCWSGETF